MLYEFREHLKSQNKSQDLIDSCIQSIQDYYAWLSSHGKELATIQEQNIDESVSYIIFEGTHDLCL